MLLERTGIPKRTLNALAKKHIYTVRDLLEWFPRKYHFYGQARPLTRCREGEYAAVLGEQAYVLKKEMTGKRKRFLSFRFNPPEAFGEPFYVRMFNNVFLHARYAANNGRRVVVCGRIRHDSYGWQIDDISAIIPADDYKPFVHCIYPKIKGVSEENLVSMIAHLIRMQGEIVEPDILAPRYLPGYAKALSLLHFPQTFKDTELGCERILFNDLLYFNLALKQNSVEAPKDSPYRYGSWDRTLRFIGSLPFALTDGDGGQKAVLNRMFSNARKGIRNNILLQGDVGCGKTIVAAAFMMYTAENGHQAVLMAPREVLARQHYEEISGYAQQTGIKCVFLHSGMKAKERKEAVAGISSGETQFIIGTHSCIAKDVAYHDLAAVITDEEHLFGVAQKAALALKAKEGVHSLSMSATPIPRTMATVLYGDDKEICIITKKPAGRLPVKTQAFKNRTGVFPAIEEQIHAGHQCYVVCPAIEENDKTDLISLEAVEEVYKKHFEPLGIRVGVVNGKLKKDIAASVIDEFTAGRCGILLSTTVIEVGVNVPNATVMVVEQADRFGLASLHQLRGRVGRSSLQSYCFLLCEDESCERVQVMCRTTDGFRIAEADLKQRGSGDLLGTAQSGINRYVEEMLDNPEMFLDAKAAAEDCANRGYGHILLAEYEEHMSAEEKK